MISAVNTTKLKSIIYKCSIYAIALFIIAIAQVTFFSKINILSATPDLLLASVAFICMREEHKISTICAIISGFFYCVFGNTEYPIYILFSFLCGYILWIVAEHSFGKTYFSFLAISTLAFLVKGCFNIAYSALFSSNFALIRTITAIVLPEFISSIIFCSIPFAIFSIVHLLINKSQKKRKGSFKNEF